jgi:hypothetical protein
VDNGEEEEEEDEEEGEELTAPVIELSHDRFRLWTELFAAVRELSVRVGARHDCNSSPRNGTEPSDRRKMLGSSQADF